VLQLESNVGTATYDPRDDNLARALPAIRSAAQGGARLIVLGELYLTGYRTDEWLSKYATRVEPDDPHVAALAAVAAETNTCVLLGAATHGGFVPGDIYNSVLIVNPDRQIAVYSKVHLASFVYDGAIATEGCFYSAGRAIDVQDSAVGRLGVQVCYDAFFPELSRVQALKGAQVLVNVAATGAGFESWWDHCLPTRAIENRSWFVMCSVVGKQGDMELFGGSRVVDPHGDVVAIAKHGEEDVMFVDIDLKLAREARATSHMLSVRRPELYRPVVEL